MISDELHELLDRLFANDVEVMANPAPIWSELHEIGHAVPYQGSVLVASHAAVRDLLHDQERFSALWSYRGSFIARFKSQLNAEELEAFEELQEFKHFFMRHNDDPEHARIRGLVRRPFAPRQIASLRENIQDHVDDLIDDLEHSDIADLAIFAYQVPLRVICDMLEVPPDARERVHQWSGEFVGGLRVQGHDLLLPARDAIRSWRSYMSQVIGSEPFVPRRPDGMLRALLDAKSDGSLSDVGVAAICINMLSAGHETSANLIGTGIFELLQARRQWEQICGDPNLVANAVEELLRVVSPTQWERRVARENDEIDGIAVTAEQTIIPLLAAANRDPRTFTEPNVVDVTRSNAGENLAFGFGPHVCIGAALARLEGAIALETLSRRAPDLELLPTPMEWEGIADLRHLARIPVHVGRVHSRRLPT